MVTCRHIYIEITTVSSFLSLLPPTHKNTNTLKTKVQKVTRGGGYVHIHMPMVSLSPFILLLLLPRTDTYTHAKQKCKKKVERRPTCYHQLVNYSCSSSSARYNKGLTLFSLKSSRCLMTDSTGTSVLFFYTRVFWRHRRGSQEALGEPYSGRRGKKKKWKLSNKERYLFVSPQKALRGCEVRIFCFFFK